MGKVYKFQKIENNGVPHIENFSLAKGLVLNMLSELASRRLIYGAKVFGSVAKGTPNERSDFDLVVVTEGEVEVAYPLLKKIFNEVLFRTKVDIEPVLIAKEFAGTGQHTIDSLYLNHIKSVANDGNIAGNNPVNILTPYDSSPTEVHQRYVDSKIRSLSERYFSDSQDDKYMVFQRALEAPVNTGRRVLQVLPLLGCKIEVGDDGKQAVIDAFRNTFKDTELMTGFNFLLEQDKGYTSFLKDTMAGRVSKNNYENYIDTIGARCILKAIKWESEINRNYRTLLEGKHKLQEGNISFHYRGKESLG